MDGWMDGPHNKILKPLFPNPFFLSPAPSLAQSLGCLLVGELEW